MAAACCKRTASGVQKSSSQADRQRAWLSRKSGTPAAAWRPIRLCRCSAKHWVQNIDNQLRVSATSEGLSLFIPAWGTSSWRSWDLWPFCAIGMDLGSDGVSGLHALQYHWGMNLEGVPDAAHGAQRSVIQTCRGSGVYPLLLLWVVHVNLVFGPDKEDGRYQQFRDNLAHLDETCEPHSCPTSARTSSRRFGI